jgi:hypothetical protein
MIWTSRVALIAYVLGGWLLPAAHHHLHHQHGVCQHVAPSSMLATSDHGCCQHSHGHDHEGEGQSGKGHPASGPSLQPAESPKLSCDGLCALCTARSLASTAVTHKQSSLADVDAGSDAQPSEPTFPPASPAQQHLSRGPPAIE